VTTFAWLDEAVVWAVHESQLAEHGGPAGNRDAGLLASALDGPKNLAAMANPMRPIVPPPMPSASPATIASSTATRARPLSAWNCSWR
jgi:hypothetical protein